MIIDAHCHLADEKWLPAKWWERIALVAVPILEKMGMVGVTPEAILKDILPGMLFDPSGEKQLQAMDEAGIDKAVLFTVDYGVLLGEATVPIEDVNKAFADLGRKYPDRFITLVNVDTRRPNALDLVKRAVDEWGMRGLKLHPASGFYPNDKATYAVLEFIAEKKLPVVTHTGAIVQPLYSKYCDPIWLDEVCVDFPELNVVAAHMGHGYRDQLFHLGACKTNLWTDISDNQRRAAHEYDIFVKAVRSALDNFSAERVMFGTDGPYLRTVLSDADYVRLIKDLPQKSPDGITFTEEEIQAVLGGNAARLFNID